MSQQVELVLKAVNKTEAAFRSMDKHLKQVEKSTKRTAAAAEKQNKAFAALGKQALMLGAGLFGLKKGIDLITSSLEAQAQQEAAINALNLALANQGNLAEGTSKRLQEYASSLQETTTFGDEAILKAQALLATFGLNEEQLEENHESRARLCVGDWARCHVVDQFLGKAFVGETGELSRYGIVIDKNIPKTEKFGAVIDQMTQRFGGSAQEATKTYAGQIQQLNNAFGDVQESIGKFIGSVASMGDAAGSGIAFAQTLQKFFGETLVKAFGETRAAFSELIGWLVGRLADLGEELKSLPIIGEKIAGEWTSTFRQMEVDMQAHAILLREQAHATAAATGAVQDYSKTSAQATGSIRQFNAATDSTTKATEKATVEVWKLGDAVMRLPPAVTHTQSIFEEWEYTIKSLPASIDHTREVFGDLTTQGIEGTIDWRTQLQDLAFQFSNLGGTAGEVLGQMATSIAGIVTQVGKLTSSFGSGGLTGSVAGFFAQFTAGLGVIGGAISLFTTLGGLIGGIFGDKEIERLNDIRDAYFEMFGGFENLGKELHAAGLNAEEVDSIIRAIFDAKTVEEYERAIRRVDEALGKLPGSCTLPPVPGVPSSTTVTPDENTSGMARGGIVLPFRPRQAATGAVVQARPGGEMIRAGEGGQAELVAPVEALLGKMQAVALAAAGGGSQAVNITIDGDVLARAMIRRNRAGQLPIREGSVRRN